MKYPKKIKKMGDPTPPIPSVATLLAQYNAFFSQLESSNITYFTNLQNSLATSKNIKIYNDAVNAVPNAFANYPLFAYAAVHKGMLFFEAILAVLIDIADSNPKNPNNDTIIACLNAYNDATSLSDYFNTFASLFPTTSPLYNSANIAISSFNQAVTLMQQGVSMQSCATGVGEITLFEIGTLMAFAATTLNQIIVAALTPNSSETQKLPKPMKS